jgi:putative DNA-invertase from lambdoid prophage Rac
MVENIKPKKKLGYARVSTTDQSTDNQKIQFKKLGIDPEDIYEDIGVSGTSPAKKRKGFKNVYDRILKGEVSQLYIFELSRLGRTASETLQLFLEIEQMKVQIISLSPNETWTTLTEGGIRNIFTSMFAWFADIERSSISERTKLAIQKRRDAGKHVGRAFKEPDRKEYNKLKAQNLKTAQIAMLMKIPATTLYRWVKKWEDEERIQKNKDV